MDLNFLDERATSKKKMLLEAAKAHFEGNIEYTKANLKIYLEHPSGVGEHSDIMGEVLTFIKQLHESQECLEIVNEFLA